MKQTLCVPGEEGCWLLCSPYLFVTGEVDTAVWHLERAAECSPECRPWKLSSVDLQTNISTP